MYEQEELWICFAKRKPSRKVHLLDLLQEKILYFTFSGLVAIQVLGELTAHQKWIQNEKPMPNTITVKGIFCVLSLAVLHSLG